MLVGIAFCIAIVLMVVVLGWAYTLGQRSSKITPRQDAGILSHYTTMSHCQQMFWSRQFDARGESAIDAL